MTEPLSVLIVDDEDEGRVVLSGILDSLGCAVESAADGPGALERLSGGPPPDLILLDLMMPGMDGVETLQRYRAAGGKAPVVIVSGIDEADSVRRAMRADAADYVVKPYNAEEVREIVGRIASERPAVRAIPVAAGEGPGAADLAAGRLGTSAAMRRVEAMIVRVADADVPVLITGESGVGKDVVARDLHARSSRRDKIFVKINCAALPSELLESELFGYERGAFTGAQKSKPGQFELAHGGTIFLDEIGEMPPALQAKLLQVLQDGEFYRVGGQRKVGVDARVIVATNVNLEKAIEAGTFREDLYYRLNVVHLAIPPLRDRREDIPGLLSHFFDKYRKRYGRSERAFPPEVITRFLAYDWPGNIRELENLVRRLMVLGDPSFVLAELRPSARRFGEVPGDDDEELAAADDTPPRADGVLVDLKLVGKKAAHAAEREAIIAMLAQTAGNKREAAEKLGISYKAILYKIREFGIGRPRPPRKPRPKPLAPPEAPDALRPAPPDA